MLKSTSTQARIGLGSVLSSLGTLVMVFSLLLGWTAAPSPWDFVLGLTTGVLAGVGVVLVVHGLIQRRRAG